MSKDFDINDAVSFLNGNADFDESMVGNDESIEATLKLVRVLAEFYKGLTGSGLPEDLVNGMTMMFMARLISMENDAHVEEIEEEEE